ncbi:MAG: metallophosphoesterase family protein [Planctomycetota bacterium]|nr:metallophosphoesterase family protein [Planctomycetota bacterium]
MAQDGVRYAIVADIHSNVDALSAVMDSIAKDHVDRILCLGDIIGYNAAPAECLKMAMDHSVVCISGNHERFLTGATTIEPSVKKGTLDVLDWTKKTISPEQLEFITGLKRRSFVDNAYLMAHGSPRHEDEYVLTTQVMRDNILYVSNNFLGITVCFLGHTHAPLVVAQGKLETHFHEDRTLPIEDGKVYLINPGSVGQPRDGCPKAAYGVFDSGAKTMTIKRVDYDIAAAQKRVREAGFEERLAVRLAIGK